MMDLVLKSEAQGCFLGCIALSARNYKIILTKGIILPVFC